MEKEIITAERLLELIHRHDGAAHLFELIEAKISGKLTFSSSIRVRHKLSFVGCEFESIEFSDAEINHELTFHKCLITDIHVISCKFAKPFTLHTCNIKGGVSLEKSTFDRISFYQLQFEAGEIKLSKTECGFFDCNSIYVQIGVDIRECTFDEGVRFSDVRNHGSYSFIDSIFKNGVWIWAGIVKTGIIFNNGTFEKHFIIEGVDLERNFSVIGATFKGEFKISFSSEASTRDNSIKIIEATPPEEIYLMSSKFEGGFRYEGSTKPEHRSVKKIAIHCSQNLTGEISFTSLKVDNLLLHGANYSGRIILHDVDVKELQLKDFANYSKLQLHNITPSDQESTISLSVQS